MQTLVRFDTVAVSFGEQVILSGADFRIEEGERLCLIGRNGAGKSTCLKLITGAIEPDDGKVEKSELPKLDKPSFDRGGKGRGGRGGMRRRGGMGPGMGE